MAISLALLHAAALGAGCTVCEEARSSKYVSGEQDLRGTLFVAADASGVA